MNMLIRPAQPDDVDAIFAITRDSFAALAAAYYSREQIDGWMNGCSPQTYLEAVEDGRIHVAEMNGAVVGYVDALPGEVTRLFVLPEAAGRGIGKKLMEVGLKLARKGHSGPVIVESLLNAVPFYEKLGFVTVEQAMSSHGTGETPPIEVVHMELL